MIALRLTEAQAQLVARACELYVRLHLGQLDELLRVLPVVHPMATREGAEALLVQLKAILFPALLPNASVSVSSASDDVRAVYDVVQVLHRYRDRASLHSVWRHEPTRLGPEPLPEVVPEPEPER